MIDWRECGNLGVEGEAMMAAWTMTSRPAYTPCSVVLCMNAIAAGTHMPTLITVFHPFASKRRFTDSCSTLATRALAPSTS
jgi:hypothetical protein